MVFQSLSIFCYTDLRLPDYSLLEASSREIAITFIEHQLPQKENNLFILLHSENVFSIQ